MIKRVPASSDYCRPAVSTGAIDWTAHERDAQIDGRRLRYVELGAGNELGFVCVHGLGGCWEHWTQTLPMLAERGRAIAIDLPGFGASQLPRDAITLNLFADTAAALARKVGLKQMVLIGHSIGGPIALRFASRHTCLVRGVILVAGTVRTFTALLGLHDTGPSLRVRPANVLASYAEALTAPVPIPATVKQGIAARRGLRTSTLWPYVRSPRELPPQTAALILKGAGARGALRTIRAIGRSDPYEGLSEVGCPILSLGGEHDRIVPRTDFEAFDRLSPAATSALLEGAGHMMMLEQPSAFNETIQAFLARI